MEIKERDLVTMPNETGLYEVVEIGNGQMKLRSVTRGGHYKRVLDSTPILHTVREARA